ncbi:uncharacterized protein LOC108110675 [Drosophila eugracilis]|uniref:uncharacterized protein LOC108110675 n=1 Tax=Drosophila eugracilis TaxID=29029 RepID=UPI001BDB1BCE|nr:uncharacterized protein LOC108110675 [Drosophila eugracilis]
MSDPPADGLGRLRLKVRLWIYGIALVFIVLAIVLLIIPGLFRGYPLVPDSVATYCFFGIGLTVLCVYVNVIWLRRKFPLNWIFSCIIAGCLALGTVSVLSDQLTEQVLLLSVEILIMMTMMLLVGSFILPECPTVVHLFVTWFIFVIFSSVLMTAVCVHMQEVLYMYEVAVHFVFWQVSFPLIVFQGQVISGYWGNPPPLLDKPLCSAMVLFDFLASYVCLVSADDIGFEYYYLRGDSNQEFLVRSIKSQYEIIVNS